jgi:hypothetical protein
MRAALEARQRIRLELIREAGVRQGRGPKELLASIKLAERYRKEREHLRHNGGYDDLKVQVKIHRLELTVDGPLDRFPWKELEKLPGARLLPPKRLWNRTYQAMQILRCAGSIREIIVQSQRRNQWAAPFRVTLIPRSDGVDRKDLDTVVELLPNFKFATIECAIDFPIRSIVDMRFVREHVLLGKLRPRIVGDHPAYDTWGSRKSGIYVRVYARFPTGALRIEFEFHSRFLRKHLINDTLRNLRALAKILPDHHIVFSRLDEERLRRRMQLARFDRRRAGNVVSQVRDRRELLWGVMRYLRRTVGLTNARRLLKPLPINREIRKGFERWSREWR